MKTLQYHKNLPKLVTLISMGLASVPAESFKHNQLSLHRISNILSVQRNLTNSLLSLLMKLLKK